MSTLFPEPPPSEELGPCAWCGATSVRRATVSRARWSSRSGVRVLSEHAIEADVCAEHGAMVDRAWAEREAEAEERRRKLRAARQ